MEAQQVDKYLDNDFVYAYKKMVDFMDNLPGDAMEKMDELQALRDAYCAMHELLVGCLTKACHIADEKGDECSLFSQHLSREIKESVDLFSNITPRIHALLPIPKTYV